MARSAMWRLSLVGLLLSLLGARALPVLAEEESYERFGMLRGSDLGYLGCVYEVDDPERSHCFAAYVLTEGMDEGKVRIVTGGEGCNLTDPEGQESCLSVIDVRRPPQALLQGTDGDGTPTVTLDTVVPQLGSVEITATAQRMVRGASSCLPYYPISYGLVSDGTPGGIATIGLDVRIRGFIDGRDVREFEQECDAIFIGPTSGKWAV